MNFPNLQPGDVCATKTITAVHGTPRVDEISLTYKPTRNRRFVFLFLGDEPAEQRNDTSDIEKRLNALGWFFKAVK